jgi:hypothetical protein
VFEEFEKFTGKEIFSEDDNIDDYCTSDDDIYDVLATIEIRLETMGIECDLKNYVWYYYTFHQVALDLVNSASEV